MKRKLLTLLTGLLACISLFAAEAHFSPINSMAYSGRFYDYLANPAALPLLERDYGPLSVTAGVSDDFTGLTKGQEMSGVENMRWTTDVTLKTNHVAFTADIATDFLRTGEEPYFDIYSIMNLQLDLGYAIPHFSVGARIMGGNSMIRRDREISKISDLFVNAWFSPFEVNTGSDDFSLGAGAILKISSFSLGAYIGDVMTLDESGSLYLGWDAIASSTTLSFAYEADRFNKRGDLLLVRPRASVSVTGLAERENRYLDIKADVTFQFLPNADLTFGMSYLEGNYKPFNHDASEGYVSIAIRGGYSHFYVEASTRFRADDWSQLAPSFSITYIN